MLPEKRTFTALYLHLAELLKGEFLRGRYTSDRPLPSERELTLKHKVSRRTVRHAIELLKAEGLVSSSAGKGNFFRAVPGSKTPAKVIGIILHTNAGNPFQLPFFGPLLEAFTLVCEPLGYATRFAFLGGQDAERGTEAILAAAARREIAGLILIATLPASILEKIQQSGVPCVSVPNFPGIPIGPVVSFDALAGQRALTEWVLRKGHRQLGYIHGRLETSTMSEKLDGFRLAAAAAGVLSEARICGPAAWVEEGEACAGKLLDGEDRPSVILCANDHVALGAYRAAKKRGLRVPRDLSLTGFDDATDAATQELDLCTVAIPLREIGMAAAEKLMALSAGGGKPTVTKLLFPVQMVLRTSVRELA